jgi:hypothetical protein
MTRAQRLQTHEQLLRPERRRDAGHRFRRAAVEGDAEPAVVGGRRSVQLHMIPREEKGHRAVLRVRPATRSSDVASSPSARVRTAWSG